MTKDELKQAIDTYLGMTGQIEKGPRGNSAKLVYYSPTGVKLFDCSISDYGNSWQFGGNSVVLPESWQALCRIHEVKDVA